MKTEKRTVIIKPALKECKIKRNSDILEDRYGSLSAV
jgi:hypothetical protein